MKIVAQVEERGVSATSLDRVALRRALALLESGEAEGLLVAKLDRLTRPVRDLGRLLDQGFRERWARCVNLAETPSLSKLV